MVRVGQQQRSDSLRMRRRMCLLRIQSQWAPFFQTFGPRSAGLYQHRPVPHPSESTRVWLRSKSTARRAASVPHTSVQHANGFAAGMLRLCWKIESPPNATLSGFEVSIAAETRIVYDPEAVRCLTQQYDDAKWRRQVWKINIGTSQGKG